MINQRFRVYIENKISNVKQKFIKYFSMEDSLGHLIEMAKKFYFISIGIDEVNDGTKNEKRFRFIILHQIYLAIFIFNLILISASDYLYSILKMDILPNHIRLFFIEFAIGTSWVFVIKIDMLLAEIKWNLSPLKVFCFLINNIKSKHKLTDLNYKRLAFLSRIVQIVVNYITPIGSLVIMGLFISIAISYQKFIWILIAICTIPFNLIASISFSLWICINSILFLYYKLRFDQIHSSIKSIVSNGKSNVINKRRGKRFINLIKEHKSVSNEIHKLNLMVRWSAGAMSIALSTCRILNLYTLINFKFNIFVNIILFDAFLALIFFGFGMTYLFSHQIKSAHQSDKLIYSILCKFNMRLKFKFKVI